MKELITEYHYPIITIFAFVFGTIILYSNRDALFKSRLFAVFMAVFIVTVGWMILHITI